MANCDKYGGGYRSRAEALGWLAVYYDKMTDYDKFWNTVDVYQEVEGGFPNSWLIRLKKIKPNDYLKDLDPSLSGAKEITVYHGATTNDLRNPRTAPSWTTDRNVAIWFSNRRTYFDGGTPICYQATISTDKIIATLSDRDEHEIIQHMGVKNIISFVPTVEEIEAAKLQHNVSN
ncbi:MAG: hypothetical protein LUE21_07095 [Oscillospiraceae bacterium]|nr:hypothetical protein [Oscillospiraceae bacterium]